MYADKLTMGTYSFWGFKYNLDGNTMHTKFDPIGVRTNDLQIMTVELGVHSTSF